MISFYSGTPGSGKSLEMAHEVEFWLRTLQKNVIANVQINREYVMRGKLSGGRFYYLDNFRMTPDFFYKYALKFHKMGLESQSLIVIDEAQFKFSPTACKLESERLIPQFNDDGTPKLDKKGNAITLPNKDYRQSWLEFFSCHRHLGYDIIIISQFDKLIDAQVRCLFEYNFIHRKANNFKTFGKLLTIFKVKMFVQVQYWYGCKEKTGSKIFFYRKKYSKIYDSYAYREQIIAKLKILYGEDYVEQLLDPVAFKLKKAEKKEDIVESEKIENRKIVNL